MSVTQRALLSLLAVLMTAAAFAQAGPLPDRPATIDDFLRLGERPRVIAHRGFSGVAPENTLVAVRRAIEVGADMVEIDVSLTRDGYVVLLHDETLDRTTNGAGLLSAVTLTEVRELDGGSWFAPEFAGEPVPTLAEVLDLVRGRILLNVEIKGEAVTGEAAGGIVDKVLALVRERDMLDQVIVSSFEPRALKHARQLDLEVKTASLYNRDLHRGLSPLEVMMAVGSNAFNVSRRRAKVKLLCAAQRHGRPVAVYTVNREQDMRRLIDRGANALFTDYPDVMLRLLRQAPGARIAGAGGC